jgi:hypothetical protein
VNHLKSQDTLQLNKPENSFDDSVTLRSIPYPYKAMLAICSDLDETPDKNVYWKIMQFLNTTKNTSMGPGVGLEVGNSIYFDMPQEQFAYWNTDDTGRKMVRTLIMSGHIDCLHSYGDLAAKREHAAKALDELNRHDCKLQVWVDHGTAPTNFGSDIMQGHGDEQGHPAYHADLTIDYGIKYIWQGRVTSITGQDVPASLAGIFQLGHPAASLKTLLKEAAKRRYAQVGNEKYSMHGPNQTLRQISLRDGRYAYEFMRCNPHWGGVSSSDQGRNISKVLTKAMLDRLIDRAGTCILYTHLGKIDNPQVPFDEKTIESFRMLAEMYHSGKILVTTTRRLLIYKSILRQCIFDCIKDGNNLCINITTKSDEKFKIDLSEKDYSGLTFYVYRPEKTFIKINNKKIENIRQNQPDDSGRPSISIDWPVLEFPQI